MLDFFLKYALKGEKITIALSLTLDLRYLNFSFVC